MKISFKDENVSVKVSHLYTYGTENPVNFENREISDRISIDVDLNEIESIVGDLVDPVKFNMFKYVALGIKRNGSKFSKNSLMAFSSIDENGNGYLTQEQMELIIYDRKLKGHEKGLSDNLYWQSRNKKYNADIAYILGSYKSSLSDNNKFYFKNGSLSYIEYDSEIDFNNFDQDSNSIIANLVNPIIFNRIDPLNLGKDIKINSIGKIRTKTVTSEYIKQSLGVNANDSIKYPLEKYDYDGKENHRIDLYELHKKWTYIQNNLKTPIVTDRFVPAPFWSGISEDKAKFVISNLNKNYTKNISYKDITRNNNSFDITSTPKTNLINDADFVGLSAEKKAAFNAQKLNKSTKTADLASSSIITDDTRIANHNLVRWKGVDTTEYEKSNTQRGQGRASNIRLNNTQGKPFKIPIDPLILDLNGDGVKTVSYTEKPVLFDIDNDGGSLEETGWLSHQDGLLVRDLNNNGKIDNMAEVFSEYYAGRTTVR